MRQAIPRSFILVLALGLLAPGLLAPTTARAQDLLISGVIDGPLPGGVPKAVEVYVLNDVDDLSAFGIGSANNGNGSDGVEFVFPAESATAGEFLYVTSSAEPFNTFFENPGVRLFEDSAANVNGDDAIELFAGAASEAPTVIDTFGDINTDGSGEAWEYRDGWAYRVDGTGPDGSAFVTANFTYSGPDALDDETTNATAATPFPLGAYSPTGDVAATVQFGAASASVDEGDTGTTDVTFEVTLANASPGTSADVTLATAGTADDQDYLFSPQSFTLSDAAPTQTIDVRVSGDETEEESETAIFSFDTVTGADVGLPDSYTLTIVDDDATLVTIAEARQQVGDGPVTIEGVVTRAFGSYFRLQDASGATGASGLVVRQAGGPLADAVQADIAEDVIVPGTQVRLTGSVSEFNGLVQINGDDLTSYEVTGTTDVPAPQTVTLADLSASGEDYESELVRIEAISFDASIETFDFSENYEITDASGTLNLRVQDDGESQLGGLPVPASPVDFVGVVGEFQGSYQLIPVLATDFQRDVTTVLFTEADGFVDETDLATFSFEVAVANASATTDTEVTLAVGGTATEGDDFTVEPTSLLFTGANPQPQTVTVTAIGDDAIEGDETITLSFGTLTGGTSAQAGYSDSVTLSIIDDDFAITLPFVQDFENGLLAPFTVVDLGPDTQSWSVDEFGGNQYALANSFGNDTPDADEDWLISPAFDLTATENEQLSVATQEAFDGPDLQLLFSTDYDGTGNPNDFTWQPVGETATPFPEFVENFEPFETTTFDIGGEAFNAPAVYFAFVYTETPEEGAQRWHVDDFTIIPDVVGDAPNAWVNEFSYVSATDPDDERFEVVIENADVGGSGEGFSDFGGLEVALYDGAGTNYASLPVDASQAGGSAQGFTFFTVPATGPNSVEDADAGFALCYDGQVVESGGTPVTVAYSATSDISAQDGCAAGQTLPAIGVEQTTTTPFGQSLQLDGAGTTYADLVGASWVDPLAETFGALNPAQVLPVELASFTATVAAETEDVILAWQTASETTNAGFAIEQRVGAGTWTEIGFVEGVGTTTEAQSYTFRVEQAGYGTHAFRLRQVDLDGTSSTSEVREVEMMMDAPYALSAYPNPFRSSANIDLAAQEAQAVTVEVYDVLGRRVATLFEGEVAAGETERLALSAQGLASGVYLVRVRGETFTATRRVTVVR